MAYEGLSLGILFFAKWISKGLWGSESLRYGEKARGKKFHEKFSESLNMLECLGNIKINNNEKNVQKTQFKIERKNLLKHNMKVVLIAFFEKQRYRKLNFFQCLDTVAMKILSPKI